jgi:hypothetical protein
MLKDFMAFDASEEQAGSPTLDLVYRDAYEMLGKRASTL